MKRLTHVFVLVLAIFATLLSACAAPAATSAPVSSGGDKPKASAVEFTGVIEAMNGNEWTIAGQILTIDPAVVRDGPFVVGDSVKVEVQVQENGSMLVSRVESPLGAGNSNDDNSNAINSNDVNGNDVNSNDANGNAVNSNDDNSNAVNSNDDNSNDSNSNDDNGNDSNSNDNDNDSNSNDDDNDSNSNDNSGGKSNDDKKDDNSGKSGGGDDDKSGGDDNDD